jgi:hypothetical protein
VHAAGEDAGSEAIITPWDRFAEIAASSEAAFDNGRRHSFMRLQ